jgi:hypothetical protein
MHNGLLGFNGNGLRAKVVQGLAHAFGVTDFVETGTYHAATAICARRLLSIPLWTCELSLSNYMLSKCLTLGIKGVKVYHSYSPTFLRWLVRKGLDGRTKRPLFYLDAHEGENPDSLPLLEELHAIFELESFVILIDDFQVPFHDGFAFGTYGNTSLNLDLLEDLLLHEGITKCYFPSYPPTAETGYRSGYVILWRCTQIDASYWLDRFPLNLLKAYSLHKELPDNA